MASLALDKPKGRRSEPVNLHAYPKPSTTSALNLQTCQMRRRPQSLRSCGAEAWAGERLALSTSSLSLGYARAHDLGLKLGVTVEKALALRAVGLGLYFPTETNTTQQSPTPASSSLPSFAASRPAVCPCLSERFEPPQSPKHELTSPAPP